MIVDNKLNKKINRYYSSGYLPHEFLANFKTFSNTELLEPILCIIK
jgi:hypothetical protein